MSDYFSGSQPFLAFFTLLKRNAVCDDSSLDRFIWKLCFTIKKQTLEKSQKK